MILESICVGPYQVNCYVLAIGSGGKAIIIDPGADFAKIQGFLDKHKLKPAFIINTHGHFDHIGCDDKFAVPIYIHSQDLPLLKDPELNLSNFLCGPHQVNCQIKANDIRFIPEEIFRDEEIHQYKQ